MKLVPAELTEEQRVVYWALGELPTVITNAVSDGSRGPLAINVVAALERQGYRLHRFRLLSEDDSEISLVDDAQRNVWLTPEQKAQPGIPDFSKVKPKVRP